MPDLFGYSGLDALVSWILVAAALVIVLLVAVIAVKQHKIMQAVQYMRWVADGGPEREEARAAEEAAGQPAPPTHFSPN